MRAVSLAEKIARAVIDVHGLLRRKSQLDPRETEQVVVYCITVLVNVSVTDDRGTACGRGYRLPR
jgi:hypothetical protein